MRSILLMVGLTALVAGAATRVIASSRDSATAHRHAAEGARTARAALDEELLVLRARAVQLDERANRLDARNRAFLDRLDVVTAALLNPEAVLARPPPLARTHPLR